MPRYLTSGEFEDCWNNLATVTWTRQLMLNRFDGWADLLRVRREDLVEAVTNAAAQIAALERQQELLAIEMLGPLAPDLEEGVELEGGREVEVAYTKLVDSAPEVEGVGPYLTNAEDAARVLAPPCRRAPWWRRVLSWLSPR